MYVCENQFLHAFDVHFDVGFGFQVLESQLAVLGNQQKQCVDARSESSGEYVFGDAVAFFSSERWWRADGDRGFFL